MPSLRDSWFLLNVTHRLRGGLCSVVRCADSICERLNILGSADSLLHEARVFCTVPPGLVALLKRYPPLTGWAMLFRPLRGLNLARGSRILCRLLRIQFRKTLAFSVVRYAESNSEKEHAIFPEVRLRAQRQADLRGQECPRHKRFTPLID